MVTKLEQKYPANQRIKWRSKIEAQRRLAKGGAWQFVKRYMSRTLHPIDSWLGE